jgi:hypothetical protein
MEPLSREARALIDEARAHEDPTFEDRGRIQRALLASLGAAALVGTKSAAAAGGAAAGTSLGALLGKAWVWGVIGGTASVVIAVSAISEPEPEARPTPSVVAPAVAAVQAASIAAAPSEQRTEAASSTAGPAELSASAAVASKPPPPRAARPAVSAGGEDPLLAEMKLIGRAQVAMREGRPEQALELLEQHRAAFGSGSLSEERAAAEVFSLCQLGRGVEARARAARFLARFPASPLAPRVRSACP